MWKCICVFPVISLRCHKQDSRLVQTPNRIKEGLRKAASTITVVQDAYVCALGAAGRHPKISHLLGVAESTNRIRVRTSNWAQKLERYQLDLPVDAHYTDTIVANGAYRAGGVRRVVSRRNSAAVIYKVIPVEVAGYARD